MYSPFPTEIAYHYCLLLKRQLDQGSLSLEQVTRLSSERAGQGVMIGVLVCKDTEGNRVVLCANSGISKRLFKKSEEKLFQWTENGIAFIAVPPVVSSEEIDRALKKNDKEIHELTEEINKGQNVEELKKRRKFLCDESLKSVHELYTFNSVSKSQFSIASFQFPTGTGDCCEPKLLHYAFGHDLEPVSLAQIFYGESENKMVPPCDERCGFLLPKMLGLEILYVDSHIVVVNKPSGLLSVPGRGEEKQDCVVNRVKSIYPDLCKISQPSVHRLDMETSGILVLAFTEEAHRNLSAQFEEGTVKKEYVALLEGVLEKQAEGQSAPQQGEKNGIIRLKFRLDPDNRPYQVYDEVYGKEGVTLWENMGLVLYSYPDGTKIKSTKVRFYPQTGRTHQLRLASADIHGFGLPIIGDSLYGKCSEGQRLMLHAEKITFRHPVNNREMTFEKKGEF